MPKRNPIAKKLRSSKFSQKVVQSGKLYNRKKENYATNKKRQENYESHEE